MRVDHFLKQSRLVKRRSLAKELCDGGAVTVNGRAARAGKSVGPGDRLGVRMWTRWIEIEIERIPDRAPSAVEARTLYRVLTDRRIDET